MAREKPPRKRSKQKIKRQESWRYIRVSESWRRPRGKSSRMRLGRRGWPASPAIGLKSPRKFRGLHPSGFEEVLIHRPEELEGLSPDKQAIRIAATVGERKRVTITDQAQRLGLKILNQRRPATAEAPPEVSIEETPSVSAETQPSESEVVISESEKSETVNKQ